MLGVLPLFTNNQTNMESRLDDKEVLNEFPFSSSSKQGDGKIWRLHQPSRDATETYCRFAIEINKKGRTISAVFLTLKEGCVQGR